MRIDSGNFSIYLSGLAISNGNQPLGFVFDEVTPNLSITFEFRDDASSPQTITYTSPNSSTLILTLVNHNNTLGVGNVEPLRIGTVNNRFLYLNYRVYGIGKSISKTLQYTFYLGEPSGS